MYLKSRYLVLCVLILISLIANTACVYVKLNSTPTQVPSTTPSPINPDFILPPTTEAKTLPIIPEFVSVIASIRPSVVAINTQIPALDIFGGTISQEGAGSGWIIDAGGLIVTNNHVVEGASSITVTLEDGRNFPAGVVRSDSISDLAVVKINATDLQAAKVGDSSKLRVGDWVVAIGNSLGQGISATKGIVGALGVSISVEVGQTLYGLIQTDAAINPGNSGGPLVNLLGEVVGITSIKVAQVGVEGVGYAISTHEALPIIDDLVKTGYVIRPWLGASLYNVDRIVILRYGLAVNQGVLVTQTAVGSPVDKAGIQAGDVITAVAGKDVANIDDFNTLIHAYNIGQQIDITFYRGSVKSTVSVALAPSPPPATP
jgi:serine protease Do